MDILAMRSGPQAPERGRIRELYIKEKEQLVENQDTAKEWCSTMRPHNDTQRKNIIGMARAVSVSAQAGAIDYRITAVDPQQTSTYNESLKKLEDSAARKEKLRREINAQEAKDRQNRLKHAESRIKAYSTKVDAIVEPGTFLQEWLNEYGRPKRTPNKEELFLTYNRGPLGIISSCKSRTTKGQDSMTMTSLGKLGNSLTGPPREMPGSLGSSDPLIKFETTRSNANSYRRGRLAD